MRRGFAPIIILLMLALLGGGAYLWYSGKSVQTLQTEVTKSLENIPNIAKKEDGVFWSYNQESKKWVSSKTPPACSDIFRFDSPADLDLASGLIYPGQLRGGEYKAHGGLRFDGNKDNSIDVYAPFDGYLYRGARHLENGEVQYSLYFTHSCGYAYKLDHLRELAPKFEEIMSAVPMGAEGDSRTTDFNPPVFVAQGEHIATKVGFEKSKNVFLDFGFYDFRKTNGVNYSSAFRSQQANVDEQIAHGLCFMDYLKDADKIKAYALPVTTVEGKTSDYCK